MSVRAAKTLFFLAIAGCILMVCESNNGPEPWVCQYKFSALSLIARTDRGPVADEPSVPLVSLKRLIITDSTLDVVSDSATFQKTKSFSTLGKIVFR